VPLKPTKAISSICLLFSNFLFAAMLLGQLAPASWPLCTPSHGFLRLPEAVAAPTWTPLQPLCCYDAGPILQQAKIIRHLPLIMCGTGHWSLCNIHYSTLSVLVFT
jgi:hypothetical protein